MAKVHRKPDIRVRAMKVLYIDHMGTDLTVVNCARASFAKSHETFEEGDKRLITYLADHNHWTPFGHPQIQLLVEVPIFVANQLKRHQVGFVVSEQSRRYVDSEPEFYTTDKLGKRADNKKQGAIEGEYIKAFGALSVDEYLAIHYEDCENFYNYLLASDVAPEDARMVLPLAIYTSFYWTGSLYAYARMYNLRHQLDTQRQTREVAEMINEIITPLFPFSWKALTE